MSETSIFDLPDRGPDRADGADETNVASSSTSRRFLVIAIIGLLAVAGLAATGLWYTLSNNSEPAAKLSLEEIKKRKLVALADLAEGEQAELIDTGESAEERNAQIAVSGLPLEKVAGFAQMEVATPTYENALKCMTQAVYYEAANEPAQGKRGVAQVVLNRMKHPAYPNSVCGVVYQGVSRPVCQFSFTCDGSLLRKPAAGLWQQAKSVAQAALAGATEPTVGTATHYHADYVLPRWAFTLAKIDQIGRHIFYRFPGSGGKSRAFRARWSGKEGLPSIDMETLREQLAANEDALIEPVEEFVPGLTVVKDVTDRHAPDDVGGRIDTTKEWRLSIPDPVSASEGYKSALSKQGEAVDAAGAEEEKAQAVALAAEAKAGKPAKEALP